MRNVVMKWLVLRQYSRYLLLFMLLPFTTIVFCGYTQISQMKPVTTENDRKLDNSGPQAVVGSRTISSVQHMIDLGKNKLKKVFESGLKRNHSLSGEIKIKLTVLSSGKVDKVYILNSSTNNAEFDEAIVNNITKWTFDKVDSSFPLIEIIVPLKFECK